MIIYIWNVHSHVLARRPWNCDLRQIKDAPLSHDLARIIVHPHWSMSRKTWWMDTSGKSGEHPCQHVLRAPIFTRTRKIIFIDGILRSILCTTVLSASGSSPGSWRNLSPETIEASVACCLKNWNWKSVPRWIDAITDKSLAQPPICDSSSGCKKHFFNAFSDTHFCAGSSEFHASSSGWKNAIRWVRSDEFDEGSSEVPFRHGLVCCYVVWQVSWKHGVNFMVSSTFHDRPQTTLFEHPLRCKPTPTQRKPTRRYCHAEVG